VDDNSLVAMRLHATTRVRAVVLDGDQVSVERMIMEAEMGWRALNMTMTMSHNLAASASQTENVNRWRHLKILIGKCIANIHLLIHLRQLVCNNKEAQWDLHKSYIPDLVVTPPLPTSTPPITIVLLLDLTTLKVKSLLSRA
jgi:hypothetical protein